MGGRPEVRFAVREIHVFKEMLDRVRAFGPRGLRVKRRKNFGSQMPNGGRGPEIVAVGRELFRTSRPGEAPIRLVNFHPVGENPRPALPVNAPALHIVPFPTPTVEALTASANVR